MNNDTLLLGIFATNVLGERVRTRLGLSGVVSQVWCTGDMWYFRFAEGLKHGDSAFKITDIHTVEES